MRDTLDAQPEAGSVTGEVAQSEQHRLARNWLGRAESGGHNRGSKALCRSPEPVVTDVCGFGRGVHGGSQDPRRTHKAALECDPLGDAPEVHYADSDQALVHSHDRVPLGLAASEPRLRTR